MPSLASRLLGAIRTPREQPYKEMGVGGTPILGGYVVSPEKSAKWQGVRRYQISSEIAVNVSIVAAGIHYFLNLISRPKWRVRPADDKSNEAVELAELVEDVIKSLHTPWPNVVRRSGMFKFHGFSVQEWIAVKRSDGHVGLRDIEVRPQHSIEQWDISEEGAVRGVFQRSPQTGQVLGLPRSKIIYIVEDTLTDSPEGLGVFRHLLEPYERLKSYLELEARAFERDLRGIPVGRAPLAVINQAVEDGDLDGDEAKSIIKHIQDFVRLAAKTSSTGILLDSDPYESLTADGSRIANLPKWDISLLQGAASGLGELASAINRLQREMARVIGTENLMLGDQGGNRALAQDKSHNLYMNANSTLQTISTSYDNDIIGNLWRLNSFPEELRPRFHTEDVSPKEADEIAQILKDVAAAGAPLMPDDAVVTDVRDLMGVSRPPPMPEGGLLPVDDQGHEFGGGGTPRRRLSDDARARMDQESE